MAARGITNDQITCEESTSDDQHRFFAYKIGAG